MAAALDRDAVLGGVVGHDADFDVAKRLVVPDAVDERLSARRIGEAVLHRHDQRLGANDVIERFQRFVVREDVDFGGGVEPLL